MLTGKKALKNFILWVAAGLLLVAGITVVFDPFYQYHGPLPGMKDLDTPKNLGLTLVDTQITGVISSATQAYRQGLTLIDQSNRREMSNITQTAAPTVNNGVVLSLDATSRWIVTGTSYITALTLAQGALVEAPAGKTLRVTVDGKETELVPGTYTGKIVLTVA